MNFVTVEYYAGDEGRVAGLITEMRKKGIEILFRSKCDESKANEALDNFDVKGESKVLVFLTKQYMRYAFDNLASFIKEGREMIVVHLEPCLSDYFPKNVLSMITLPSGESVQFKPFPIFANEVNLTYEDNFEKLLNHPFFDDCKIDPEEGLKNMLERVQDGDAQDQYVLAGMYWNGIGTEVDYEEAIKWLQLAANQGYAPAQYMLGHVMDVDCEEEQALEWYQKAADQGYHQALYAIGVIHFENDEPEAYEYFMEASRHFSTPDLYYYIAMCLQIGLGVEENQEQALKYFVAAADAGSADAAEEASECFKNGIGTEVNMIRAHEYEMLAVYNSNYCESED